jgi:hypothetical protein
MSEYCPAGKCECEHFDNGINEDGLFCRAVDLPLDIYLIEVCPYPSRQVPAVVPDTQDFRIDIHEQGFRDGFRTAIQQCREAVGEIKIEYYKFFISRPAVLAAISKVEEGMK